MIRFVRGPRHGWKNNLPDSTHAVKNKSIPSCMESCWRPVNHASYPLACIFVCLVFVLDVIVNPCFLSRVISQLPTPTTKIGVELTVLCRNSRRKITPTCSLRRTLPRSGRTRTRPDRHSSRYRGWSIPTTCLRTTWQTFNKF